jgi:hypothetical protein
VWLAVLAVLISFLVLSQATQDVNDVAVLKNTCGIDDQAEFPVQVHCLRGETCAAGGGELQGDDGTCLFDHGEVKIFTSMNQVNDKKYIHKLLETGSVTNSVLTFIHTFPNLEVKVYDTKQSMNPTKFSKNKFQFQASYNTTAFVFFGPRLNEVNERGHPNVYYIHGMNDRTAIYHFINSITKYKNLVIINDLEDVDVTNMMEAFATKNPIESKQESVERCSNAAVEPPYDSLVKAYLGNMDHWFAQFWRYFRPVSLNIRPSKIHAFEHLKVFLDIIKDHTEFFQKVEEADMKNWHNLFCNAYVVRMRAEMTGANYEASDAGLSETEQEYLNVIKPLAGHWRVDSFIEGLRKSLRQTRQEGRLREKNLFMWGEKNKEHQYNSEEFWRRLLIEIVMQMWQYHFSMKFFLHVFIIGGSCFIVLMMSQCLYYHVKGRLFPGARQFHHGRYGQQEQFLQYGQPLGYGHFDAYGHPPGYGQSGGYGHFGAYGQPHGYGETPKKTPSSKHRALRGNQAAPASESNHGYGLRPRPT